MKNHFKNNWYLYLIGLAIILIILKLLKDRNKPFQVGGSFSSNNGVDNSSVNFSSQPDDQNLILSLGSQGNEVRTLQNLMNNSLIALQNEASLNTNAVGGFDSMAGLGLTFATVDNDGVFGQLTENLLFYLTAKNSITLNEYVNEMS